MRCQWGSSAASRVPPAEAGVCLLRPGLGVCWAATECVSEELLVGAVIGEEQLWGCEAPFS